MAVFIRLSAFYQREFHLLRRSSGFLDYNASIPAVDVVIVAPMACARLRAEHKPGQAAADMKTVTAQLEKRYPDANRGRGATVWSLTEVIRGDVRPVLIMLLCGAALLLTDCMRQCCKSAAGASGETADARLLYAGRWERADGV